MRNCRAEYPQGTPSRWKCCLYLHLTFYCSNTDKHSRLVLRFIAWLVLSVRIKWILLKNPLSLFLCTLLLITVPSSKSVWITDLWFQMLSLLKSLNWFSNFFKPLFFTSSKKFDLVFIFSHYSSFCFVCQGGHQRFLL